MELYEYAVCLVLYLWLDVSQCASLASASASLAHQDDICGPHNGRRIYLEQGEKGVLTAKNVSTTERRHQPGALQSHEQCSLEVVTCPSCVIVVRLTYLSLSPQCGGGLMDAPCRCDYLWLSEPPYDDVSGTPFCGLFPSTSTPPLFRSQTRTLVLALLFSQNHRHAFTLEYSSERNRQHVTGKPGTGTVMGNFSVGGVLTSPFFPSQYPRDLGAEYIISCLADNSPDCRVRLLFNDFQLAGVSIMEFYDWNGQRLEVSSGALFRPPVIVSTGPSLLVRFYANGGTGIGFKASYSFLTGNYDERITDPITDCGGFVENLGGAITMMNMVERGGSIKSYDCIWLIRPPNNFYHLKTHIYLKVATFLDMGSTELVVRQGLTSEGPILDTVRHPVAQLGPSHARQRKENILPLSVGFYVSLRGTFSSISRLAIVYTSFTYMECFTGSDYLCQNHRCIPAQLHCDGFDHCGDNSDEPDTCTREWDAEPLDRRWYSHTPNYYFPKMERYPDLKTATLVFVISSLGLILLIAALVVLLYRMGARARQQRELQSRLQTISDLLDGAHIEEVETDDPPVYEAPPDYEEVIKRKGSLKRKKNKNRRVRSTSAPRLSSHGASAIVSHEVNSQPAAEATTPLLTGTSVSRSCQVTPIPDSPPPPYSDELHTSLTPAHSLRPEETAEVLSWEEQTLRAFSRSGKCLTNTPAVPNVDTGLSFTLMNTSAVPTVEAGPPYTENYTLMNNSAVPNVDAGPSYTLMNSSAVINVEAGPSYSENHSLTNMSAVPSVEAGPSYSENHSLTNMSVVPSVEAGRYYPDNQSMISIDCSSPYAEGNEISLSPVRQSQNWANVGMIEESTIFKRRLHRTPRRRGGLDVLERLSASHDCACEGACGCMRPVSAEPLRRIHSTWSPTSYTLQALDIYFNQLERGSKSCLPGQHVPFKLSNSNGLSLSISMSVDNLKDIV